MKERVRKNIPNFSYFLIFKGFSLNLVYNILNFDGYKELKKWKQKELLIKLYK